MPRHITSIQEIINKPSFGSAIKVIGPDPLIILGLLRQKDILNEISNIIPKQIS